MERIDEIIPQSSATPQIDECGASGEGIDAKPMKMNGVEQHSGAARQLTAGDASAMQSPKLLSRAGSAGGHDYSVTSILPGIGETERLGPRHFERICLLGRGDVGRVFLVRFMPTGELYAMKVLSKTEMKARNKIKRVMTEREILATVDHPFIITLHACFQTSEFLYFIMDYCGGGEFFRMMRKQPGHHFDEKAVMFYSAEVLMALDYLHSCGFVYRDLKPENILVHSSGHIMLTDFDLSKKARAVEAKVIKRSMLQKVFDPLRGKLGGGVKVKTVEPVLNANSFVGTEEYLPPEIIRGAGHSSSVDWWTFGILVYEMTFGTTPFKARSQEGTFANITSDEFKISFPESPAVSTHLKKLIKGLLNRDPEKRLGAKHGAAEIRKADFFSSINWALVRNMQPPVVPAISSRPGQNSALEAQPDAALDEELLWAQDCLRAPHKRQSKGASLPQLQPSAQDPTIQQSQPVPIPSKPEQAQPASTGVSPSSVNSAAGSLNRNSSLKVETPGGKDDLWKNFDHFNPKARSKATPQASRSPARQEKDKDGKNVSSSVVGASLAHQQQPQQDKSQLVAKRTARSQSLPATPLNDSASPHLGVAHQAEAKNTDAAVGLDMMSRTPSERSMGDPTLSRTTSEGSQVQDSEEMGC